MSYAYRCQVCVEEPAWFLIRRGDATASWACDQHLSQVCRDLQRFWERTELIVSFALAMAAAPVESPT